MRRYLPVRSGAMLLLALALTGCASSGATTATTITKIPFKSSAIVGTSIPARYTCDGKDDSPPLEWGAVPAGTRELALLIIGFKPTASTNSYSTSIDWALAGVNPALHRLPGGPALPPGVHLGSTTNGGTRYSICPSKGTSEVYQFTLYAVPQAVTIPPEFVGLRVLIEIGAERSPNAAHARGAFEVGYERK